MWQIISAYICGIITTLEVITFGIMVIGDKEKVLKKNSVGLEILVSFIYAILYLNLPSPIKTLLVFLITIFLYKYIFKITIPKAIFITFLYVIILIIPDLIELFFATKIIRVSKTFYYNEFAGSILGNLTICILFLAIVYLIKKPLRKLIEERIDNNKKILLFSILTFVCIGLFFYTIIKEFRFSNDVILYLIAIAMLLSVLFGLIKQTIENNKLTREYDKLLEFMVTYENEIEKQRILRHETKNEFRTIRAKICDKQDNKAIIEYIDEILNDKY